MTIAERSHFWKLTQMVFLSGISDTVSPGSIKLQSSPPNSPCSLIYPSNEHRKSGSPEKEFGPVRCVRPI